jgi:hypothetical protein
LPRALWEPPLHRRQIDRSLSRDGQARVTYILIVYTKRPQNGVSFAEEGDMQIVRNVIVAVVALGFLAGCAVGPTGPSIVAMPGKGKSFEDFQSDDATCRQFAAQQAGIEPATAANQSLFGSAVVGTLMGAAAGAAIGAATGNPAAGAAIGAASGLGLGTVSGLGAASYSSSSVQWRYDVGYSQCMSAKGDSVPQLASASPGSGYPGYGYGYYAYPAYSYPYYYPYGPAWYGPPGYVSLGFHVH